jgi:PAS domain S-box-containing protein
MKKYTFAKGSKSVFQNNPSGDNLGMAILFDMVPDLLCVASADGYFKWLNPAWESLLGFTVEELTGRPLVEFIHPDDVAGTLAEIEHQLKGSETKFFINRYRCKDGSYRWLEWHAVAGTDRSELYAVARDVTERYIAEQALRESEEKYQNIFNTSPDAININTLDGPYVDINEGFTKLTGYTKDEVLGSGSLHLGIWANPEDREKLIAGLKEHGSVRNLESVFRAKDGSLITGLMSASEVTINNKQYILSVTRDITLRKKVEDDIRMSENRFRQIAGNAAEMIWDLDVKGLITFCNDAIEQILGYSPEEVIGRKHFYDFFDPAQKEEYIKNAFDHLKNKDNIRSAINNNLHKDGHTVILETNVSPVLDNTGEVIGYRGTCNDITHKVFAEQALRESEEKYRLLAVNSSDVIWTTDLEGNLTYVSPSVKQFQGYTPEEVMEMGIIKFLTPASAEVAMNALAEYLPLLKSGQQNITKTLTFELVCKDGSHVWAEITASTMFNDNHEAIGIVGITRDVTERLLMEEKLKNSEQIFRSLAEYSPNMIFIIMQNKIYYVNQVCEKKLGYTREELYAPDFDFDKLAIPEHKNLLKETISQHTLGMDPNPFEFLMTGKDGQVLYTMVNTKFIQFGKEDAVLGLILDISEQRWAEEILKRKAVQFEQFSKIMVDRELKLVELKKEVNLLLQKLGEERKYELFDDQ